MSATANPKRRSRLFWRVALASGVVLASILVFVVLSARDTKPPSANDNTGIHKIKHIIMIMQENRSFDHYFGTFPGADGIEMLPNGQPKACVPNPKLRHCQRPYVDHRDNNAGGPHSARSYVKQINGGKMDGFAKQAEAVYCAHPKLYTCGEDPIDVMGYHVQSDIPNYWKYAQQFVLQDHMFEPT